MATRRRTRKKVAKVPSRTGWTLGGEPPGPARFEWPTPEAEDDKAPEVTSPASGSYLVKLQAPTEAGADPKLYELAVEASDEDEAGELAQAHDDYVEGSALVEVVAPE